MTYKRKKVEESCKDCMQRHEKRCKKGRKKRSRQDEQARREKAKAYWGYKAYGGGHARREPIIGVRRTGNIQPKNTI